MKLLLTPPGRIEQHAASIHECSTVDIHISYSADIYTMQVTVGYKALLQPFDLDSCQICQICSRASAVVLERTLL